MLDRIRFCLRYNFFFYNPGSGLGCKVEKYNPFTDRCRVRYSTRGYIVGHDTISRTEFLRIEAEALAIRKKMESCP